MDKYEELQCIGRGSYGSAHLAIERATKEKFVIKKIPTELLTENEKKQSFREIELLAKLKHPNVVEYKESFVEHNTIHIVMGYCDGGDLAARIRERAQVKENDPNAGYFTLGQILDWFVQMAMAIKYLHDNHVLHRDLKTSNIFLTKQNVVKLGDFGIARTLESTFDQAKTVVGTPFYMSPEVCESRPYSYASDVWSLGCVLYELCALKHAFDAQNILMLILKIVQQDFPPLPPHFDNSLTEILIKLLDKRPENRPTMDQLFTMPFIRTHMQVLVASGGSLKATVGARRLKDATPRRRSRVKGRRASTDNFRRRLSASSPNPASVRPQELQDQLTDDDGLQPLSDDASLADLARSDLRLPERSCTPEPLLLGIQDPAALKTEVTDEHLNAAFAWAEAPEQLTGEIEVEECMQKPTPSDTHETMNPNFQDEYSEECIDSMQIFYRARHDKDNRRRGMLYTRSPKARSRKLRNDAKAAIPDALDDVLVEHLDDLSGQSIDRNPEPGSNDLEGTLSIDEEPFAAAPGEDPPSNPLTESVMLRQFELDQESSSDEHDDAYTSRSEYGGEDNFYSDDQASYSADSDFDRDRDTVYSDEFEDAEAEIIEYADDAFIPEDEENSTTDKGTDGAPTPTSDKRPLIKSPMLRPAESGSRNEVAWVMQNVAQSLLESCDQFSLLAM